MIYVSCGSLTAVADTGKMSRRQKRKQQFPRDERYGRAHRGRNVDTCVHCRAREGVTHDHVISRCFFSKQPENHLTAPACDECNRAFSADEEYVRNLMCISAGSFYKHPVATELANGVVARSFARSPKLKFTFDRAAKPGNLVAPGGIVIPNQVLIDGNMERINRVMAKITRGLLYCYADTILPSDYHVVADFGLALPEFYQWMAIISQASRFGKQAYPDEVFALTGAWNRENPAESVWLMSFYKRFTALTVTAKAGGPKAMVFADMATGKPIAEIDMAA